jgi:hypothetical protein
VVLYSLAGHKERQPRLIPDHRPPPTLDHQPKHAIMELGRTTCDHRVAALYTCPQCFACSKCLLRPLQPRSISNEKTAKWAIQCSKHVAEAEDEAAASAPGAIAAYGPALNSKLRGEAAAKHNARQASAGHSFMAVLRAPFYALVKHQTSAPGKRVAILDVCRDNARMRFKKVFNEHSTVCELLLADLIISIQRLWIQRIYTVLGVSGSLNDCECPALWTSSKILQSIAVIRGTSLLYWAPWLARR